MSEDLMAFELQKTPGCPLYRKEIKPSILREMNSEYWLEGLPLKPEAPVFWPPNVKSQFIGKVSDAGRDWGQEEKGITEGEMASRTQWT